MSGSTIPAVLDALISTFDAALPGVEVVDGSAYDPATNVLCVAWDGDGQEAVVAQRTIADARRSRDQETYEVICLLTRHDKSIAAARESAFASLELILSALAADQTVGVAGVTRAWVTEYALMPSALTESGATVQLRFGVSVIAWK